MYIGLVSASDAQSIGLDADWYRVIYMPHNSKYPAQIFCAVSGNKNMYYRTCVNGVWDTPRQLISNADMVSKQIASTTDSNGLVSVGAKYPDYKKVVCTTTRTATIMHVYHNDSEWRAKVVDTSNNAIANTNITINCIAFK